MILERNVALGEETWRLFRIMAEFVDGFELLMNVGSAVTVFGSARTPPGDPYYEQAVECGRRLAQCGFAVITGGGPGIMEAANKGASQVPKAKSVGLNITLPLEQKANAFLSDEMNFRYFFVRKVMFVKYASGFVIFPGGLGTLDEFFESLTLIQTLKIKPFPVVCIGQTFWSGMRGWMQQVMFERFHNIDPQDLELFRVTDDVEEAVRVICEWRDKGPGAGTEHLMLPNHVEQITAEGTRVGIEPGRVAGPRAPAAHLNGSKKQS